MHPLALSHIVDAHFGALEADFQRYYNLDLRRALWGEAAIGARRLINLIEWLPPESALARSCDPLYAGTGWDNKTELLATIAELVDQHSRMFFIANSKKGTHPPKPIKIPRPGQRQEGRKTMDSVQAMNTIWAAGAQVYKEEQSDRSN